MDFRKLHRAAMPTASAAHNSSEPLALTELPVNILDALIPGYSVISRYVLELIGFDISIFVSVGVLLFASTKGLQWLRTQLEWLFRHYLVSSVYIDDGDDLFDMMMSWLDAQSDAMSRRSVKAKTQRGSQGDESTEGEADAALDEDGMFNFNKWSARIPPRYEPYYGRHFFWYKGRLFIFYRSKKPAAQSVQVQFGATREDDLMQLDCVGRSTEPIKDLLKTVKAWSLNKQRSTTSIRHPTPKDQARRAGAWSKTSSRPSRPMETVILDEHQKTMIQQDMNEYLHPLSPKWYATRGIPYRRGYLFHGPPGTGKTSLSFALAGIFGLEIYAISLQEPTLTEGDLMQLFNGLPRRCIVLLEDIDSAGLIRDGKSDDDDDNGKRRKRKNEKEADEKDSDDKAEKDGKEKGQGKDGKRGKDSKATEKDDDKFTLQDLAKELKSIGGSGVAGGFGGRGGRHGGSNEQNSNRQPGTGISLSGLLNAIDGVATHEGRILIMTTNHPEKLDAALIRPGRVDMKIKFRLAMHEQVRELFIRMYSAGNGTVPVVKGDKSKAANGSLANGLTMNGHAKKPLESAFAFAADDSELKNLALEFADKIPEDTFTPAEIQGHLMRYKKTPQDALDSIDHWVKETIEDKEKQRKAKEKDSDGEDE